MSEPGAKLRTWASWVARVGLSSLLLWWLMRQIRGGWSEVGSIEPTSLWPAALIFALSTVLGAWQWTLILQHAGVEVPARRLHQLYWVGLFFNNFLPSNVGGDLVKIGDVAVHSGRVARAVAGTLLDRMLGLSALVTLAFAAGALLGGGAPAGVPWWLLAVLTLPTLGLSAALLSGRMAQALVRLVVRVGPASIAGKVTGLVEELRGYRADPLFVLRLGALALVVQGLRVGTHLMVARAMGLPLDATTVLSFYVLVPVLGVAIVLPISFNGLGVRELVATRLMPEIGIVPASAFALQIATFLVQVAVSLVGGAVFAWMLLRGRFRLRRPESGDRPG